MAEKRQKELFLDILEKNIGIILKISGTFLPLLLIILVFITSILFTFKYSIYEQYRKLNKDIFEIEQLEHV